MRKLLLLIALLPLTMMAQRVASPNGQVEVIFSLDGTRPQI